MGTRLGGEPESGGFPVMESCCPGGCPNDIASDLKPLALWAVRNVLPEYRWITAKGEEILLFQRLTRSSHQGPMTRCEIDEQLQESQAGFSGGQSQPLGNLDTTPLVTNPNISLLAHLVSRDRIFLDPHQFCISSYPSAWIRMEIQVIGGRVRMPKSGDRQRKITKVTSFSEDRGTKYGGYFSMLISEPKVVSQLYFRCTLPIQ
jgi:hypothetical protein